MATSRIACDTKLPARDARCATPSGAPLGATDSYHPYDLWLKQSTMLWRSDASEISLRCYDGRQLIPIPHNAAAWFADGSMLIPCPGNRERYSPSFRRRGLATVIHGTPIPANWGISETTAAGRARAHFLPIPRPSFPVAPGLRFMLSNDVFCNPMAPNFRAFWSRPRLVP
jgi:hypothetical protein